MAKIIEQVIVARISHLVKDSDESPIVLTQVDMQNLEAVLVELAGERSIIEIESTVTGN